MDHHIIAFSFLTRVTVSGQWEAFALLNMARPLLSFSHAPGLLQLLAMAGQHREIARILSRVAHYLKVYTAYERRFCQHQTSGLTEILPCCISHYVLLLYLSCRIPLFKVEVVHKDFKTLRS